MRKRKRDWPVTVYRYRVHVRGGAIPQPVWDTAHAQQRLWNDLVTLANRYSEWARLLGDKKAAWDGFDPDARALVAQSPLNWVNGPDVLDRLRTAMRSKKWPRYHSRLDRVAISHRFTGGGLPISKVIDNPRVSRFGLRSSPTWRIRRGDPGVTSCRTPLTGNSGDMTCGTSLKPEISKQSRHLPLAQHWQMHFEIGETAVDGPITLHRELPQGVILKRATLTGERAGRYWFWYINLTLETQPARSRVTCVEASESSSSAGLDLGWRLFADGTKRDYLRVGMLADSEGRTVELRLPLNLKPNRVKETRGLATIGELQQQASALIERGKTLADNRTLGYRGLRRLLSDSSDMTLEALSSLGPLLDEYDRIYARIAHLRFRLIQRRRWYYQNLAQWLCQRYRVINLEDMALPRLHERSTDPALRNAAQYRNYAAVGELRIYVKRAAARTGAKILEGETAGTTITCWRCGSLAMGGATLELICAQGHRGDQDINSARNLLSEISGDFGQAHDLRNLWPRSDWKRLQLPEIIRAVAVEVPAI